MNPPTKQYFHEGEEVIKDYASACTWLTKLGLKGASSRYARYEKIIKRGLEEESTPKKTLSNFKSFCNAYVEASELIRIHTSFRDKQLEDFEEQISKAIKGKEFSSSSDSSRNFLFELSMSTRFMQAGYKVDLSNPTDVIAYKDLQQKIFVECKRVYSEKQLQSNIRKASKQILEERTKLKDQNVLGLIALDLTELMGSAHLSFPPSATQGEAMHKQLSNDLVKRHLKKIKSGKRNKVIGVLCQMIDAWAIDTIDPESPLMMVCRGTTYVPYRESEKDYEIISSLSNRDY